MGAWILIVLFASPVPKFSDGSAGTPLSSLFVMQEFLDAKACQNAAAEVQKIAPWGRSVCVPKAAKP